MMTFPQGDKTEIKSKQFTEFGSRTRVLNEHSDCCWGFMENSFKAAWSNYLKDGSHGSDFFSGIVSAHRNVDSRQ